MPVRGSNLVEEAEKRKENILQKIKAVNVKPDISYENNFENQDENSYQENEEEIRKNSIKVLTGYLSTDCYFCFDYCGYTISN